jgi:hypothetical protein
VGEISGAESGAGWSARWATASLARQRLHEGANWRNGLRPPVPMHLPQFHEIGQAGRMSSHPPLLDLPLDHPDLEQFTRQLGAGAPRLVLRSATERPDMCFWNVRNRILLEGGSMLIGWRLYYWPSAYLGATHHGIWRRGDGVDIDITPHYPSSTGDQTTFIDAPTLPTSLEWPTMLDNQFLIIGNSPIIKQSIYQYLLQNSLDRRILNGAKKHGGAWTENGLAIPLPAPKKLLRLKQQRDDAHVELGRLQAQLMQLTPT